MSGQQLPQFLSPRGVDLVRHRTEVLRADADLNIVMNSAGDFIEVQGTGEGAVFSRTDLDLMLDLAEKGIRELLNYQAEFTK